MHARAHAAPFAVAALLLSACTPAEPPGRVLVVGIDGASPLVVERLLAEGRLPTLARLAEQGTYARIDAGVRPIASPVVWTTVATGKEPEQHGIRSFTRTDENGGRVAYDSSDRRTHAVWNIASDAGLSVSVINWWNTFPPEVVDGLLVSDYALPGVEAERSQFLRTERSQFLRTEQGFPSPVIAYPAERSAEIRAWLSDSLDDPDPANPFLEPEDYEDGIFFASLARQFDRDVALARLAARFDERNAAQLTLLLLTSIDRASHVLWRYVEPAAMREELRPPPDAVEEGLSLLESCYANVDRLLGVLLAGYDLERDLVVVLSDHGFEPGDTRMITGRHASERAAHGVLFVAGKGVRRGAEPHEARAIDITPTILRWLGLPIGDDMRGRALGELFAAEVPAVATTPTHDRSPVERLDVEDPETRSQILEELRALGYLDG